VSGADGPVTVGLDLGTGSARALAVAADGTVLGRGAQPLHSRRDGDRHEQDPAAWWEAIAAACREALAPLAAGRPVAGVATCATSGTVLLVDRDGRPASAALMYDDTRAAAHARRLDLPASWALPKLHWLLDERSSGGTEGLDGLRLAHQPDVVTRRLTGHAVASDASHALKTGYDPAAQRWPDSTSAPAGVLPEVVAPGTQLGVVGAHAAQQTGLPAGTPIFAGMTDGCAAQIAGGALRPGDVNAVLGTTLVLKGCSPQRIEDRAHGVYSHRAPGGGWLPGGASSSGAGVLLATFPGRDLDALGRAAAQHERTRVLAYPLVSRGERFPFAAPDAEAFMLGTPDGEGEHAAALMQGVALVERLCLAALQRLGAPVGGEVSLTGGATRNPRWSQLRADALGRSVRLPEQSESAFGMAILAAAASTGEPLADAAGRMSHTHAMLEPRDAMRAHLDEQFERLVGELRRRGWLGPPRAVR
jgi:sugar (pentulose or hexulose) kinase